MRDGRDEGGLGGIQFFKLRPMASVSEFIELAVNIPEQLPQPGQAHCYNFMPVLDWARTDLAHENPNGANNLYMSWGALKQIDQFLGDVQPETGAEQEKRAKRFGQPRMAE